jgi:hypothetical protein
MPIMVLMSGFYRCCFSCCCSSSFSSSLNSSASSTSSSYIIGFDSLTIIPIEPFVTKGDLTGNECRRASIAGAFCKNFGSVQTWCPSLLPALVLDATRPHQPLHAGELSYTVLQNFYCKEHRICCRRISPLIYFLIDYFYQFILYTYQSPKRVSNHRSHNGLLCSNCFSLLQQTCGRLNFCSRILENI